MLATMCTRNVMVPPQRNSSSEAWGRAMTAAHSAQPLTLVFHRWRACGHWFRSPVVPHPLAAGFFSIIKEVLAC